MLHQMLLMSLLVQVFIIAVFNFVIVYYVFTSVDRGDGGRFSPKLQSRLPKESVEVRAANDPSVFTITEKALCGM